MNIIFTYHARERAIERGIKLSEIRDALFRSPRESIVYEDKYKTKYMSGGKIVEIIFAKRKELIIVITAYYL